MGYETKEVMNMKDKLRKAFEEMDKKNNPEDYIPKPKHSLKTQLKDSREWQKTMISDRYIAFLQGYGYGVHGEKYLKMKP